MILLYYSTTTNGWLISTRVRFLVGKRERQIVGRRGRLHSSLSGPVGPRSRARPPVPAAGPRLAAPAAPLRPLRGLGSPGLHGQNSRRGEEGGGVWERKSHFYVSNDGGGKGRLCPAPLPSPSLSQKSHLISFCESWLGADVLWSPRPWEDHRRGCSYCTTRGRGGTQEVHTSFLASCLPKQTVTHNTHTHAQTLLIRK